VHIQEHGVNYQQSITYDPWTQIARVHNPHHLIMDETITLMHKPSGMMMMLNNNHKHCEYSVLPEGLDPESFAQASKDVEEEHRTVSVDVPETVEVHHGSVEEGTLTQEEREDLHPEMQTLCAGLDIFRIRKIQVPADFSNSTELVDIPDSSPSGSRVKRDIDCIRSSEGEMVDKCKPFRAGWGHSCIWIICSPNRENSATCQALYVHMNELRMACVKCCERSASSSLCRCADIHTAPGFTRCQKKMECNLELYDRC